MRPLCSFAIAILFAGAAQAGENLLRDGASFEVGLDGFNLNNHYLFSHRGREIEPLFDETEPVHRKFSLRIDNPLLDKVYVAFRPIRVEKDQAVTVSGYLRGRGTVSVQLMRWPWKPEQRSEAILRSASGRQASRASSG